MTIYNDILTHIEQFVSHKFVFQFTNKHLYSHIRSKKIFTRDDVSLLFVKYCSKGNFELVKFIYQFNPDVYYNDNMAFIKAPRTGNVELVKWLIQINDTFDQEMFQNSIYSGNIELIKMLHKPTHYMIPEDFYRACSRGYIDVVKYLNPSQHYPNMIDKMFRLACTNNHLELAKYLLQFNPDAKSHDFFAFVNASEEGEEDMVKFLVQFKPTDDQFESAIIRAYQNDHNTIFDFLIKQYGKVPESLKDYQ